MRRHLTEPCRPVASKRHKFGFTFIELLVVVAIIAILAAILFPVFARARENARRANCQSNLKQLAAGYHMYAQDFDDKLPYYNTAAGWEAFPNNNGPALLNIRPYVKGDQIFRGCPSVPKGSSATLAMSNSVYLTYAPPSMYWAAPAKTIQIYYNSTPRPPATGIDAFEMSSKQVLLAESRFWANWNSPALWYGYMEITVPTATKEAGAGCNNYGCIDHGRHLGGSNIAFLDGHVKWYPRGKTMEPQATRGFNYCENCSY